MSNEPDYIDPRGGELRKTTLDHRSFGEDPLTVAEVMEAAKTLGLSDVETVRVVFNTPPPPPYVDILGKRAPCLGTTNTTKESMASTLKGTSSMLEHLVRLKSEFDEMKQRHLEQTATGLLLGGMHLIPSEFLKDNQMVVSKALYEAAKKVDHQMSQPSSVFRPDPKTMTESELYEATGSLPACSDEYGEYAIQIADAVVIRWRKLIEAEPSEDA